MILLIVSWTLDWQQTKTQWDAMDAARVNRWVCGM